MDKEDNLEVLPSRRSTCPRLDLFPNNRRTPAGRKARRDWIFRRRRRQEQSRNGACSQRRPYSARPLDYRRSARQHGETRSLCFIAETVARNADIRPRGFPAPRRLQRVARMRLARMHHHVSRGAGTSLEKSRPRFECRRRDCSAGKEALIKIENGVLPRLPCEALSCLAFLSVLREFSAHSAVKFFKTVSTQRRIAK